MTFRRWISLASVALVVAFVPTSGSVEAQVRPPDSLCAPMTRGGPDLCLDAVDSSLIGGRTPVLLIHGWAFDRGGPPRPAVWDNFIAYAATTPWIGEAFKFYNVSYFSNVASVPEMGRVLAELVDGMDARDSGFAGKKFLVIGHSMGGLLARSFMQEWRLGGGKGMPGGDRVLRLVTLGTPHHGTPVANGPMRDDKAGFGTLRIALGMLDNIMFRNVTWAEPNRSDLHADRELSAALGLDYPRFPGDQNLWLDQLNANNPYRQNISAYAGAIRAGDDWDRGCLALADPTKITPGAVLDCSALLINGLYNKSANDGIVPLVSALYDGCATCTPRTFAGYDHYQIAQGLAPDDAELFGALVSELSAVAARNTNR